MDVSTFYALFSATCFTLLGLWWGVVQRHEDWMRDPGRRSIVGGIYLAFLLPALMGLFAQVGGPDTAVIWRGSFVVVAIVGCVSTLRLLRAERDAGGLAGPLRRHQWAVAVIYVLIAVVGSFPALADPLGLAPLQVAAMLLILLVLLAHGLVWEFMVSTAEDDAG